MTSAMVFFTMFGTVAFGEGRPTGISTNGRSFFGRLRMLERNPIGLGVWVRVARPLQGGEQKTGGDVDGLLHVVVLGLSFSVACLHQSEVDLKRDDQVGRRLQEFLVPVRA
jgi:hypothetical protein